MKNVKFAGLLVSLAVLGGCSAMPENDALTEVEVIDVEINDAAKVVEPLRDDSIPVWYIDMPRDDENKIYGAGAGLSSDLQFSIDKALHQAKIVLGDKMSTTVSSEIKTFMSDNSLVTDNVVEETQRVSKSGFKDIDVSKYEIEDKEVFLENDKFRAYILLSLNPTTVKKNEVVAPADTSAIKAISESARGALDNL